MSLDIDARLKTFFASAPQTKYVVPVLEIRHSAMSKVWYLWREAPGGPGRQMAILLEDGSVLLTEIGEILTTEEAVAAGAVITLESGIVVAPESANFSAELAGTPAHLDQEFHFTLSTVDIEDQFRNELDRIPIDTQEKIALVYREYLSDDLTYPNVVASLQVESLSYQRGAATISAVSPRLNITRTGELYTPRDIPMLRGFL